MAKKNRISSKNKQLESQQKKEGYRRENLAKEEQKQQLRREQERREKEQEKNRETQEILSKVGDRLSVETPRKKSTAKAAGLKSALVLDQRKILVTSFGKGNEAVPQVEITFHNEREDAAYSMKTVCEKEQSILKVEPRKKQLQIDGRADICATADNPIFRYNGTKYQNLLLTNDAVEGVQASNDLIGAKAALEKRYFDTDGPCEDNIHIQIIHSIQDIEKIVALYATEIVYTLNNILGKKKGNGQAVDLIGMMSLDHTYQDFMKPGKKSGEINKENFEELLKRKQLKYFGDVMPQTTKDKNGIELTDKQKEKAYLTLATLGTIRQATTHGNDRNAGTLFSLDIKKEGCRKEAIALLGEQYSQRVEQLNRSFAKHAYKDVNIICRVLRISSDKEKEQMIRAYYNFIIRKTYKSLGFSVKALRETLSAMDEFQWMNREKYDSVRHKLNHIVDFLIVRYFEQNEGEADCFVECLRASGADSKGKIEEEKNNEKRSLYVKQALRMKEVFKQWLGETLQKNMQGDEIRKMASYDETSPENHMWKDALSSEQLRSSAHAFSTLMYLMTRFLNGKEINELLTKTANRFDNIASFMDVAEMCGRHVLFREDYKIFVQSKKIAEEIRVINSFARMSEEMRDVSGVLMKDAVILLGISKEESDDYTKWVMGEDNHELRNFLINNVIKSSRFQYLVRYSNPENARKLANTIVQKGNPVLKFVLKWIPKPQLVRYYESCTGEINGEQKQIDELIEVLADFIRGVDIRKYEKIRNSNKISSEEKIKKECTKNILGLYLTVLYLLQKNLTNINARYIIAFHCFERDSFLLLQDWIDHECENSELADESRECKKLLKGKAIEKGKGMKKFVHLYYTRGDSIRYKKRVQKYVQQNIENAFEGSILSFRNNVAHLNVIRNSAEYIDGIREVHSYFELYHYMMQRCLIEEHNKKSEKDSYIMPNKKTLTYFEKVQKYGTYCKDYVKALNVPFAYNLPRYKNVSINELFDRNDYLPDKAAGWDSNDE